MLYDGKSRGNQGIKKPSEAENGRASSCYFNVLLQTLYGKQHPFHHSEFRVILFALTYRYTFVDKDDFDHGRMTIFINEDEDEDMIRRIEKCSVEILLSMVQIDGYGHAVMQYCLCHTHQATVCEIYAYRVAECPMHSLRLKDKVKRGL